MFSSEMFIQAIQQIFEGYRKHQEHNKYKNAEISMWRRKFLEKYPFDPKEPRIGYVHRVFLSLPLESFTNKTPEETIYGLLHPSNTDK